MAPELELDEDIELHKMGWKFQRVAWFAFTLLILLFVLGLFGSGTLSKKTLKGTNCQIEYERFLRYEHINQIKLYVSDVDEEISIKIPQGYLENFFIEKITPTPESVQVAGGKAEHTFLGKGEVVVSFYTKAEKTGKIEGNIHVEDQAFPISHFIYP